MAFALLERLAAGMGIGKPTSPASWRTPAILDRGLLGEACLALDERGHGQALWENRGELWTMPIGPRSSPALLRLPMGEGAAPRIVLNREGRGLALWQSGGGGERQILGKVLGGGDGMGHVIFRTGGRIQHLQAAVDRRGNALVAWLLEGERGLEVLAQAFNVRERGWEKSPTTLGIPSDEGVEPRIAVNHREHAMVLWEVREAASEGLVASHYWPTDGIWSDHPVPVVAHATRHHQVAMDDQGNALALWIHAPHGQRCLLEASFYDVRLAEWSHPETLATGQVFTSPRLVMTGTGEALAAWGQGEGHGAIRLFAKGFRGGKWQAEAECLDRGHGRIVDFALDLALDGRAGLLAVEGPPENSLMSVRLREGGAWSAPTELAPASGHAHSAPQIRMCPKGVSALWIQGQGSDRALHLAETR